MTAPFTRGRRLEVFTSRLELVAERNRISGDIDAEVVRLLQDGEFVEDIADALDESREKVRRVRNAHDIPDAREIRRAMGGPARRPS